MMGGWMWRQGGQDEPSGPIVNKAVMARLAQDVLNRIRGALFAKINHLSLSYHDRHESGVTMSRIVNDVSVFQELLTQGVLHVVADALLLIGIISIMLYMSPK